MSMLIFGLVIGLLSRQRPTDGRIWSVNGKDITIEVHNIEGDIFRAKDKNALDRIWKQHGHGEEGRGAVYSAYRSAFKDHPTALITAGFAGVWRVVFGLGQHHLTGFNTNFSALALIKSRLDKADALDVPDAIYQYWLLLRDVPSSPFGDEKVVGYTGPAHKPDGTIMLNPDGTPHRVPIIEGGSAYKIRDAKIAKLVSVAKKKFPNDVHLEYMVACEMAHGEDRYNRLCLLTNKYPDILGIGGMMKCRQQALELKRVEDADQWLKRSIQAWSNIEDPTLKEYCRQIYSFPK